MKIKDPNDKLSEDLSNPPKTIHVVDECNERYKTSEDQIKLPKYQWVYKKTIQLLDRIEKEPLAKSFFFSGRSISIPSVPEDED